MAGTERPRSCAHIGRGLRRLAGRELARFIRRLAAHFPGLAPAIICVAKAMSELEMGHFTRAKFGTPADPHLVGVIDE